MTLFLFMLFAASPAASPAPDAWLAQHRGVVEMALAHDHGALTAQLDGGVLTIDPNNRVVTWEGIPGSMGCKLRIEATFDDVKGIEAADGPGFRLRFHKPVGHTLVLIPRPHAQWLRARTRATDAATMTALVTESLASIGAEADPDGRGLVLDRSLDMVGQMATIAPRIHRADLPREVVVDTRTAIDTLREALGRSATPTAALREALYRAPQDLEIAELVAAPVEYHGQAIRVTGVLAEAPAGELPARLAAGGQMVRVTPLADVAKLWTALARTWVGREVEVTGTLAMTTTRTGKRALGLSIWDFALNEPRTAPGQGQAATIEDLTLGRLKEGEIVRVVGLFRGRNLFGEVAGGTVPGDAWVIKSGAHAIWVMGKPAAGEEWHLDADAPEDASYWVEVVGQVSHHKGKARIRAREVALTTPPPEARVSARAAHHTLASAVSSKPPVLIFALPLDGESGVAPDVKLVLQFSKYMDEQSFRDRVRVRYTVGDEPPRELTGIRLSYDDTRRALIVDPGETLPAGGRVECLLLPGIVDIQGLALVPRAELHEGAIDVLRYTISAPDPPPTSLAPRS